MLATLAVAGAGSADGTGFLRHPVCAQSVGSAANRSLAALPDLNGLLLEVAYKRRLASLVVPL